MAVTRRRHGAHVAPLRAVFVIICLLLVLGILSLSWAIRAPLPKIDGTVRVPGLSAEVVIRRDARGIPHIAASDENGAFYGEGFACAQDRLWQMDLLRREAQGRLSEIFGPATKSIDEYFRTIGLADVAASSASAMGSSERGLAQAYAAGVNAAMADHELPLEFRLLGYKPDPWTPADSIVVGLLITRSQDDNWHDLLVRADLIRSVGERAAAALTDAQIPALEEYVPGYAPARLPARAAAARAANPARVWAQSATIDPAGLAERQGSNAWSVAPKRSSTGKPVLSNDTHLDHSLPSTWWIAQVEGGTFDVEGFTLPGVPGIIIGHNRRIAWGVTSAAEDVEDVYVEKFAAPSSYMYLANGRWERAQHRLTRIHVKGESDDVIDVLVTRHGPVVERSGERGLALAWTVLRDGVDLSAIDGFDRAGDWSEFRRALSKFIGPTLDFVYADVSGHIGYQDAGRVPMRAAGDGSVPVEGEDDRYAWVGEVAFDRLPRALDPPRGLLATANNALVPPAFTPSLSRNFLSPYRIHEIVRRLSQVGTQTPQTLGAIQADSFDYPNQLLATAAVPMLSRSSSDADRRIAALLAAWNGDASVDSTAPTFMAALDRALEFRLLQSRVGIVLDARYDKQYHFLTPVVRTLNGDTALSSMGMSRAALLAAIVPAAHAAEAELNFPAHPLQPWGTVNAAVYDHPLGRQWPLTLLNAPVIPQPGDPFAVFQSKPDFGPSMRLVANVRDWDSSSMLITLGESGVWTDPHYDDMERDWVNVAWSPTPFTDAAVAKAATDTLKLEPDR